MNKNLSLEKRKKITLYACPGILALDMGFLIVTVTIVRITVLSWINFNAYNFLLSGVSIFSMTAVIVSACYHISWVHWVITGFPIKTWEDLKNWHVNP
jgi:hypothetical protein